MILRMCSDIDLEHGFHFLFSYQEFNYHQITFESPNLETRTRNTCTLQWYVKLCGEKMILLMYLYLYLKSIVTTHTVFMYAGLDFVL